jgi:hypothetical protein
MVCASYGEDRRQEGTSLLSLRNARAYCDWLWQQYRMSSPDSTVPDTVKTRLEYVRRGLEVLPR